MEQLLRNPREARLPEKLIRERSVQEMKRRIFIIIACVLAVIGIVAGRHMFYRNLEFSQRRLDLAVLERITDGTISHELRWGRIFVTTVDRFGDGHIHLLHHSDISKRDALRMVQEKEAELKQRKPNNQMQNIGTNAPTSDL
jgi:hypothetical protein